MGVPEQAAALASFFPFKIASSGWLLVLKVGVRSFVAHNFCTCVRGEGSLRRDL